MADRKKKSFTEIVNETYALAAEIGMHYETFMKYTPYHFRVYYEAYYKSFASKIDMDNLRAGKICATIMNVVSKRKFKPEDFFKKVSKPEKPKAMSTEHLATIFKAVTTAMGGVINDG